LGKRGDGNVKATFRLLRENVGNLKPCVHGGEVWEIASKFGFREDKLLDFSSSVNPLGASQKALKAIKANLMHISDYPDSNSIELREAIANRFEGISKDHVVAGNGSTELIYLFAETFLTKGDVALIPAPTFSEYERAVRKTGVETKYAKPKKNFQFSLDVLERDLSSTKAVFFCNPNNPTSLLTPPEQLTALVERALEENVFVFLDEDFLEFVDQEEQLSLIGKVDSYPNLFVLRSFTKIFGLTGLRVGYGVASKEMTDILLNAKIPWNVNYLAQVAAIAALEDEEHLKRTRELIRVEKAFLMSELTRIEAFKVFPADANFLFIDVRKSGCTAARLKEKMLRHGILIRDCSSFKGLDEYYVRVAVKTRPENTRLLDALRKTVKSCT
jgi:threonine-phosphate decarboxylase